MKFHSLERGHGKPAPSVTGADKILRTELNIGCRYGTPVRKLPLHPTRSQFTSEASQTQAPVTPATEPERHAGGSLTTISGDELPPRPWCVIAPPHCRIFPPPLTLACDHPRIALNTLRVGRTLSVIDFSRNKSLKHTFGRLITDGHQLYVLGCMVQRFADIYEIRPDFEIETLHREDTIKTNDPKFFVSEFMPTEPKLIKMSIRKYDAPVSMQITLGEDNTLNADGSDTERVLGMYSELKSEIERLEAKGEFVANVGKSDVGFFLSSILSAALVYFTLDTSLDLAYNAWPDFKASGTATAMVTVGWVLVFVSLFVCPIIIRKVLAKSYPSFEYVGGLSYQRSTLQRSTRRRVGGVVIMIFLIPILLNLIAGFLQDIVKGWLN